MTLVEQYKQLHNTITERAIYINNMLARMDVAEHLQDYLPDYCGVCKEVVQLCVSYNVVMLSYEDCDNYTTHWYINSYYIEMSDEHIKEHYLQVIKDKHEVAMALKLRNLHGDAKMFGYKLVKEDK